MSALQIINPSGRAWLDQSHFNLIFYNNYTRKLGKLIKTKWLTFFYATSEFSYYISSISFLAVKNTILKLWRGWFVYSSHRSILENISSSGFFFFFKLSVLCKLLLLYLRPKFCTQLNFLYLFLRRSMTTFGLQDITWSPF